MLWLYSKSLANDVVPLFFPACSPAAAERQEFKEAEVSGRPSGTSLSGKLQEPPRVNQWFMLVIYDIIYDHFHEFKNIFGNELLFEKSHFALDSNAHLIRDHIFFSACDGISSFGKVIGFIVFLPRILPVSQRWKRAAEVPMTQKCSNRGLIFPGFCGSAVLQVYLQLTQQTLPPGKVQTRIGPSNPTPSSNLAPERDKEDHRRIKRRTWACKHAWRLILTLP